MNTAATLRLFSWCLAFLSFIVCPTVTSAETVSILVYGDESQKILVEGAMKRNLRAEGYTVKGGTTDGYLLVVDVMPFRTVDGSKRGVIGHVMVSSMSWQTLADSAISSKCKDDHALVERIKSLIGTPLTFIDSTIGQASNEEDLAEILSTYANTVIRASSRKVTGYLNGLENQRSREILNPTFEQMR